MTLRSFWLALALIGLAAKSGVAAEHRLSPGDIHELQADLILTEDDTVDFRGTPEKPITIRGGGHQIRTGENWRGELRLRHIKLSDLGRAGINPEIPAIDLVAGGTAKVDIEECTFSACGGVRLTNQGESQASFRRNTILADSLVAVSKDVGASRDCFLARGNSPAPKFFQGNRIFKGHCTFESPRWLIGGDTDAESNLLIGHRIKIVARGNTSIIRGNYLHVLMPRNAEFPYWSQVSTVDPGGNLLEHNVIRDGEWIVQMFEGEVRYNVICDINDHNLIRNGSAGKVHHNLFHVGKPEHPPGSMSAFIYIVYPPKNAGEGMEIYNNTFDGCGIFEPPGVEVCEGGFVRSLRNNAFCNMKLTKYFALPPAVVRPSWQEKSAQALERLGYADYNLFHNPLAKEPRNYSLQVAGKSLRQDTGFGKHDVPTGGPIDAQVDPQFSRQTPTSFPFRDEEIVAGRVTVSGMLRHFREVYTPRPGSPLLDSGDPADGEGTDIGAIGGGKTHPADQFGRWAEAKP